MNSNVQMTWKSCHILERLVILMLLYYFILCQVVLIQSEDIKVAEILH